MTERRINGWGNAAHFDFAPAIAQAVAQSVPFRMASGTPWSDLKIGVIALVAILALVVSILVFARVGAVHGDTSTLYVITDNAGGVLAGSEVWLSGEKVGLVKAVRLRPVTTDTTHRLLIETRILTDRMPLIRKDSRADIKPGGNLLAQIVVYVSVGTLRAAPVKEGDTLVTTPSSKMGDVGVQVDSLGARLSTLKLSSEKLLARSSDPANSAGAFRHLGIEQIGSARDVASRMFGRATSGNGTLGQAYRGDIGARIRRVMSAKDSIMLLLSDNRGNVGAFRRDSTLPREITRVRAQVDSLRAMVSGSKGSAAQFRSDTALKAEMIRARAQLDSLMRDIKKHPMRYISF